MGNRYTCSQTFEEWCVVNNRKDILNLWDYEKNDKLPSEVPKGTKTKYWFKCPNGLHESEARRLSSITDKPDHQLICLECNNGVSGRIKEDLTGKIFGELTVIGIDKEKVTKNRDTYWICKCSCGNIVSVVGMILKTGQKIMCGGKTRHKRKVNVSENEFIDVYSSAYLQQFRKSIDYNLYRQEVMKKDGYKCIVCGTNKDLEVHHIYPFAIYPNDRLNPKTGICMCKIHHSISSPIGFHKIYGMTNNTPEQLEEYVNSIWRLTNIEGYFDVYNYMEDFESDNIDIDDSILIDLYE